MKTAEQLFEEHQKMHVPAKSWKQWSELENWEKTYWINEENRQRQN